MSIIHMCCNWLEWKHTELHFLFGMNVICMCVYVLYCDIQGSVQIRVLYTLLVCVRQCHGLLNWKRNWFYFDYNFSLRPSSWYLCQCYQGALFKFWLQKVLSQQSRSNFAGLPLMTWDVFKLRSVCTSSVNITALSYYEFTPRKTYFTFVEIEFYSGNLPTFIYIYFVCIHCPMPYSYYFALFCPNIFV